MRATAIVVRVADFLLPGLPSLLRPEPPAVGVVQRDGVLAGRVRTASDDVLVLSTSSGLTRVRVRQGTVWEGSAQQSQDLRRGDNVEVIGTWSYGVFEASRMLVNVRRLDGRVIEVHDDGFVLSPSPSPSRRLHLRAAQHGDLGLAPDDFVRVLAASRDGELNAIDVWR